jgi:hypothetical protein
MHMIQLLPDSSLEVSFNLRLITSFHLMIHTIFMTLNPGEPQKSVSPAIFPRG